MKHLPFTGVIAALSLGGIIGRIMESEVHRGLMTFAKNEMHGNTR